MLRSISRRCSFVLQLFLGGYLLMAAPRAQGQAQEASEANLPADYKKLVDEGLREFSVNNYEEARSLFLRAHERYPNARTHRALGLAEFELRNYRDSVFHLQEALKSQVRPLSEKLRAETRSVLDRAYGFVARLHLQVRPLSARLFVDGDPITTSELLLLPIGEHKLEVRAEGFETQQRSLQVKGGEEWQQSLVLLKRSAPVAEASGPVRAESSDARRADARPWYKNPWLWTGVGIVVAGAAAGTAYAFLRKDDSPHAYGGSSNTVIHPP